MEGTKAKHSFQVGSNDIIRGFIDSELYSYTNKKSNEIFLVYAGREIQIDNTF